ncbi:CdaR family transcriptional regulator [Companilactobacillus sp. FL22-1]|uniref:CdaR family transcriptional regulator n=1 Tax=Companilactobacillus sp. FL22-1 TaxID=3373892 RepID=UPI0037551CD0
MKLDPALAQAIVDKMMENVPYNINMMNEKGYIIASGDKERLNTLHIGAIDTIKSGKTKPMVQSYGIYGKPGVNIPIEFKGETIGVIGITGNPQEVTPLASLLKISTELLISQLNNTQIENQHKESLNHFLFQWIEADDVQKDDELRLRANTLGIDLTLPRFAIIISTEKIDSLTVKAGDYHFEKSSHNQLLITKSEENVQLYLDYAKKNNLQIGISNKMNNLKTAVKQATDTITVSSELNMKDVFYFKQIKFLNHLLECNLHSNRILEVFKGLYKTRAGQELLLTLDSYFKHNGQVTDTSKDLNVHRNTTNYRLNKLSEYFSLDLHDLNDTLQLYINYLYFQKYLYNRRK